MVIRRKELLNISNDIRKLMRSKKYKQRYYLLRTITGIVRLLQQTIEERFALEKIEKDQYEKFRAKYNEEIYKISIELSQDKNWSSNLKIAVQKSLSIAANLQSAWDFR